MLDPARSYDLIGDVHGCAHALEYLLDKLGYHKQAGIWRHTSRMAVFLGDIIDRGPWIREALHIIHDMSVAGQALCIMGNHEFNALGWTTPAPSGSGKQFVRDHSPRHEHLLHETLTQFEQHPADWHDFLGWFYEMPLFVDAVRFRVVHACWDDVFIHKLCAKFPDGCIDQHFLHDAAVSGSFAFNAFDRLLRGTDMLLPDGLELTGSDGLTRSFFRTKFWEDDPKTYGDIVFQPDALPEPVARRLLSSTEKNSLLHYGIDEPLLFVGHYWRSGRPSPIRENLACLDYSAVLYGKLVAYRLDQETRLDTRKFVWVDVDRTEIIS